MSDPDVTQTIIVPPAESEGIEVLSHTQRIIVRKDSSVAVISAGPPGPPGGPAGPRGPEGAPGPRGETGYDGPRRYYGDGDPPTVIIGARPGDEYLDELTGNLYVLQ